MYDDAASADYRRGVGCVGISHLVVVDNAAAATHDLDAELVRTTPAGQGAVDGRQYETVAAGAVDDAGALVLGLGPPDHQPVVAGALEVQAGQFEIERSIAGRDVGPVL